MVRDLAHLLAREDLWMRLRLRDGFRIVGPTWLHRREAGVLEQFPHRSQLLGKSHKPWMNTTGVRPDAFARSTCWDSCSVISPDRSAVVLMSSSRVFIHPTPRE